MTSNAAGREYFEKDAFARELGLQLLDVGPGTSRVRLPTPARRTNGLGTTHGAVIFSLADVAFAVACNSHGQTAIGVQANISYLAAAEDGPIEACATEISYPLHEAGVVSTRGSSQLSRHGKHINMGRANRTVARERAVGARILCRSRPFEISPVLLVESTESACAHGSCAARPSEAGLNFLRHAWHRDRAHCG